MAAAASAIPRVGAKKSALSQCGGGCRILYEGANKVGAFEIEYY